MSSGGELIEGSASSSMLGSCSGSPLGPWLWCELELRTLIGAASVGDVESDPSGRAASGGGGAKWVEAQWVEMTPWVEPSGMK